MVEDGIVMAIENQEEARIGTENPTVKATRHDCAAVDLWNPCPVHELSLLWKNSDLSEGQIHFQFDGHPVDKKGISKQLEIDKEDIIESFHSLASFWSYDKDWSMHSSCYHGSLEPRSWYNTAEIGGGVHS